MSGVHMSELMPSVNEAGDAANGKSQARIKKVQCYATGGLHRIAYKEWGAADNPRVLICVHGVTRVSDDFDALAASLASEYRVICPDIVGRGRSDHLRNPALYQIPQYVSDMVTLIARVLANTDCEQVDWFGTSMGGLIGMGLAAQPSSPIRKLILNDIGPSLNAPAMQRIAEYIGQDVIFDDYASAAQYIRAISLSFGPHSEEQWDKLVRDVLRQQSDGRWKRHYDIALATPFKTITEADAKLGEAMLWQAYDAIVCPTLLVRGGDSDLLTSATAQEMTRRGPKAQLVELPGIGHAPTFVQADQIALVHKFLLGA